MSIEVAIKKSFPNMFRPLKWMHFDSATEYGKGEWFAHGARGTFHIYDVREKFPNDRPFYAKEISDQFDTLEQAQAACQARNEGDILIGLSPDFISEVDRLQRENAELRKDRYDLAYAITGGEDAPGLLDSVPTSQLVEIARGTHRSHGADIERASAAEAEVKQYRAALYEIATNDEYRILTAEEAQTVAQKALASTGGEHHAK